MYYRRYRRYSRKEKFNIFDALAEIIFAVTILFGQLLYKLVILIFQKRKNIKQSFVLQDRPVYPTSGFSVEPASQIHETSVEPVEQTVETGSRYTLKPSLLTDAEKEFLTVLKQVIGEQYQIESQVQLSRIVRPLDSNGHFTNYHDFNLIKAKSIDFVLYDKEYRPYLAIELDDSSHLRWDRIKRDHFVNELMQGVGLRIIHVPVSYSYDIEYLKKEILFS